MTPTVAKKLVKAELEKRGLSFTKLTAKTIRFSDLARDGAIFVKIHGWKPSAVFAEVKVFARKQGFCIETETARHLSA